MKNVAIVSGGSRGLGAALVSDFLTRGYRVATFSRSFSPFIEECLARDPGQDAFHWEKIDGSNRHGIDEFVRTVRQKFSRIDVLVNCAAILPEGMLTLTQSRDVEQALGINVGGAIWLTQACVKVMLALGTRGGIVNISSINAHKGREGVAVYSATKAALEGLTRALAKELGPRGIRVNAVAPGFFESDMTHGMSQEARDRLSRRTPLGRLGRVDDVVGVVRFIVSENASFITGQTIVVDGGLTC